MWHQEVRDGGPGCHSSGWRQAGFRRRSGGHTRCRGRDLGRFWRGGAETPCGGRALPGSTCRMDSLSWCLPPHTKTVDPSGRVRKGKVTTFGWSIPGMGWRLVLQFQGEVSGADVVGGEGCEEGGGGIVEGGFDLCPAALFAIDKAEDGGDGHSGFASGFDGGDG
jgi:hypothetical protein